MKLAEEITITVADEVIELRPSLGHAIRLERRAGSFRQLITDVQEGSLSAAVEIIGEHTAMLFLPNRVFDVLPDLRGPLLAYVMACMGIDPDEAPAEGKAAGKPVPFADHLASLYRLGTGWLGWTPGGTLASTPAEIMEAYKGRLEMLKAIFGSGESKPKDDRPLDQKLKGIFAGIGTTKKAA